MKQPSYLIRKKAVADLEEIWFYTVQHWSVKQADRYYTLIIEEINYICQHPESGKSQEHIRKNYRSSKVKSHLIFYRVVNQRVEVVRILHERMDIDQQINSKQ